MTIRALRDFMETRAEGERRLCGTRLAFPFRNVTQLSIAGLALLVSHLPNLFPLFCAFCPRQKEDAAKKGTSSRKESLTGSP